MFTQISVPVFVVTGNPGFDYFFTLCCIFGAASVTVMIIVRLFSRS